MYGVSCVSAKMCMAVGHYFDNKARDVLLLERWDGRAWSIQQTARLTPEPQGGGISCASTTFCMLVEGRRAERWDGSRWTIVATPKRTNLLGVSCASPTHCIAVGDIPKPSPSVPDLVEVWNRHTWQIQPAPTPDGTNDAVLNSVSCTTTSSCTAVGSVAVTTNGRSRHHTLAERWNGERWTIHPTPSSRVTT